MGPDTPHAKASGFTKESSRAFPCTKLFKVAGDSSLVHLCVPFNMYVCPG